MILIDQCPSYPLHSIATNWTIGVLTIKPTSISSRLATQETIFTYEALLAAEESRKAAKAAQDAIDRMLGLKRRKPLMRGRNLDPYNTPLLLWALSP